MQLDAFNMFQEEIKENMPQPPGMKTFSKNQTMYLTCSTKFLFLRIMRDVPVKSENSAEDWQESG